MQLLRGCMLALILLLATAAAAQIPDEFTNLQFHPADLTKAELMNVMRNFSLALGVRCVRPVLARGSRRVSSQLNTTFDNEHR